MAPWPYPAPSPRGRAEGKSRLQTAPLFLQFFSSCLYSITLPSLPGCARLKSSPRRRIWKRFQDTHLASVDRASALFLHLSWHPPKLRRKSVAEKPQVGTKRQGVGRVIREVLLRVERKGTAARLSCSSDVISYRAQHENSKTPLNSSCSDMDVCRPPLAVIENSHSEKQQVTKGARFRGWCTPRPAAGPKTRECPHSGSV